MLAMMNSMTNGREGVKKKKEDDDNERLNKVLFSHWTFNGGEEVHVKLNDGGVRSAPEEISGELMKLMLHR